MDTETIMQDPAEADQPDEVILPDGELSSEGEIGGDAPAEQATTPDLREELLRRAEEEGLLALYPGFDVDEALADPSLGALLRGDSLPSLRHLYEITHFDQIVESRVQGRLESAVAEALASAIPAAVSAAVAESEERLLAHIRARGQRPDENGTSAASGIRMHPAVDRLTRRERAMLAERAERGETIKL